VGCGTHAAKSDLQRVVVVDGLVEADPAQRRPGRGAYVCNRACAEIALRRGAFNRAFRCAVRPDPDLVNSVS
jgi:predicted RNA-binding protein YlxR (DUF448 family)